MRTDISYSRKIYRVYTPLSASFCISSSSSIQAGKPTATLEIW